MMTHRRGFTLVEILLAISLLGAFSLLAFRLLGANMDITQATVLADSNTARFDRAVRALRSDMAGADAAEPAGPDGIRIHRTGAPPIEWKAANNMLSRSVETRSSNWDAGQPLHLKLDGAVLLLSVSPSDEIAIATLPKGAPR